MKGCFECQQQCNVPCSTQTYNWVWPGKPWERIHADFASPFQGADFLVSVDAHYKWPQVYPIKSTNAEATVTKLRRTFSKYEFQTILVSDNEPQFVLEEYKTFVTRNGMHYVTSAPYHPSTNGLTGRFVQLLKQDLRKNNTNSLSLKLSKFSFWHRNTPHSTKREPPSLLMFEIRSRSRLDVMKPFISSAVSVKQFASNRKRVVRFCSFEDGDSVLMRHY